MSSHKFNQPAWAVHLGGASASGGQYWRGVDTVSRITDKVIAEMTEWVNRPLEGGQFLTNLILDLHQTADLL